MSMRGECHDSRPYRSAGVAQAIGPDTGHRLPYGVTPIRKFNRQPPLQ